MDKIISKTSEAVSPGHPDKVADQISDSIFDFLRHIKPDAQSAVETACSANKLMIFGEIDSSVSKVYSKVELATKVSQIATQTLNKIGYDRNLYNPEIIVDLVTQSEQINNVVEKTSGEIGAGDQGITFGFATSETNSGHELHYLLAVEIQKALYSKRVSGELNWLYPDAKSQVK